MSRPFVFVRAALTSLCALSLTACGGDDAPAPSQAADAGAEPTASQADAGTSGGSSAVDAASPSPEGDGGTSPAPVGDALAPFQLDCARLPTNGACQGGPREVLLVMEETGLVSMHDPVDGHFLGYFKRPADSYYERGIEEYSFATQGPDQCIWTVSEEAGIERWNTDGSFKDAPLKPHFVPVPGGREEPVLDDPKALAFTADKVYVASEYGNPNPRISRFNLDGSFDAVVFEDPTEVQSLLVLGDGSLLIAQHGLGNGMNRVARVAPGETVQKVVLGGIDWPGQISYAPGGKLLVTDITLGNPVHEVDIGSSKARTIYPATRSASNKQGIAALKNGKWLLTGGEFLVSSLDPASMNPMGQYEPLWTDPALDSVNFKYVGRACVPESLVAARASKPANDTCIEPPAGAVLFAQDFESGVGSLMAGAVPATRVAPGGAPLTPGSSLELRGGKDEKGTGARIALPHVKPSYVRYFVKLNNVDHGESSWSALTLGSLSLRSAPDEVLAGVGFYNGYVNASNANLNIARPEGQELRAQKDVWMRVELRNIDWTTRTYDLYLDCKRVAEGIALGAGADVSELLLNNWNAGDDTRASYFDDLLIK